MFEDDEDELDDQMTNNNSHESGHAPPHKQTNPGPFLDDHCDPHEDELDVLLAEEPLGPSKARVVQGPTKSGSEAAEQGDEFDDEEEVLASMGW